MKRVLFFLLMIFVSFGVMLIAKYKLKIMIVLLFSLRVLFFPRFLS